MSERVLAWPCAAFAPCPPCAAVRTGSAFVAGDHVPQQVREAAFDAEHERLLQRQAQRLCLLLHESFELRRVQVARHHHVAPRLHAGTDKEQRLLVGLRRPHTALRIAAGADP